MSQSPIETIRRGKIEDLLALVRTSSKLTPAQIHAVLNRCNRAMMEGDPSLIQPVCLEMPDLIHRTIPIENKGIPNLLAWSHGILATCFSVNKLPLQADHQFDLCFALDGVSPLEASKSFGAKGDSHSVL